MNKALILLKDKGLRATVARLQLLTVLQDKGRKRMTAEDIFMDIDAEGGSLSLASVYRVLKELSNHGLVERSWRMDGEEIRMLFSLARTDGGADEPEIVCVMCHRATALPQSSMRADLNHLAQAMNLQPEKRPIVIQVTCPGCAQGV